MSLAKIDFEGRTIYKWTLGVSNFLAMPEAGARLMNWHVNMADGSIRDVIHWPENPDYNDIGNVRGGMPVLFPFVGPTLVDGQPGRWKWQGHRWPMPAQGLARDAQFTVVEADDTGFVAQLVSNEDMAEHYPYDFVLTVRYRFREMVVEAEMTLENTGRRPLPWCPGFKAFLHVPWESELALGDYELEVPATKAFRLDDRGALQEADEPKPRTSLADAELAGRIYTNLDESVARVLPKGQKRQSVAIKVGSILKPHEDVAYAIEGEAAGDGCCGLIASQGPANAPGHGRGVREIAPGFSDVFAISVQLFK